MGSVIFPDLVPSVSGFNVVFNTRMAISGLNAVEQIIDNPGERWEVSLVYRILRRPEAMLLRSHLHELRGHVNKSVMRDLGHDNAGALPGTPVVDGANQYGNVLNIKNVAISQIVAMPGHRFKLGNRVHEITRMATSNSSGRATLYLANEILNLTTDNASLETSSSNLTFSTRWSDPKQINQLQGNKSTFRNVRLNFIEALV